MRDEAALKFMHATMHSFNQAFVGGEREREREREREAEQDRFHY